MKLKLAINRYVVTNYEAEKDVFKDDYVAKAMGSFGLYQGLICGTAVISRCIVCWNVLSIVFLTSKTEFVCIRFKDDLVRVVQNSTCYDDCVEYQYYSHVFRENLIPTFGLICDRAWLASFTQTMLMFGLALGVIGFGWLSDRFGRRLALLLSLAFAAVFMICAPFATNYWLFSVCRLFCGFGAGGIMTVAVVFNMEMVGQKYRELMGVHSLVCDGIGIMLLALVGYYSSTYHIFMLIFGLIAVIIFVMLLFMPESPRWLVSQRQTDKAIEMMTKVAKFNRLETSHIIETNAVKDLESEQKDVQKRTFLDLFATKELATITIVCIIVWLLAGLSYFGISHYATLLGLDIFVIVPVLGFFQVIGNLLSMPLNKYIRRKVAIVCTFIMVAVMMTILIFIPDGHWVCAFTTMVAAIFTTCGFCVFYIHINEMFPTPLRSMGVGVGCFGSKIGAMAAPFIANMQTHWISSTIFAVVPFVGAALCLLLPETKGKKMKDTVN